jgi:hypothetical protein
VCFGFWFGAALEAVLALTGQLLDLPSEPVITRRQAGVEAKSYGVRVKGQSKPTVECEMSFGGLR